MIHELRIYHAMPGRMADLQRRFETATLKLWERHGIRQVGFWTVLIGPNSLDLYYMLEWEDLAERERRWNAFLDDPLWAGTKAETEAAGPLLQGVDSMILKPTAFSRMR